MEANGDKKQSGQIILFVIFIIIFLMLFVTLFLTKTLAKQSKSSNNIVNSVQAFYVADSGSEYALYRFTNVCSSTNPPSAEGEGGCIGRFSLLDGSGGECTIQYDEVTRKMSITGDYKDQTSRAIELTWSGS